MRRLVLLLAGLAVLLVGVAGAAFTNATKAETRWLLVHAGSLVRGLAVGLLAFGLSLTSSNEHAESGPSFPSYSRDGAWVAFTSDRAGPSDVYVARVGGVADRITDTDHGAGGLAWSPDGSRIVFSGLTGQDFPDRSIAGLYVVNRDGSGLRQITSDEDYWPCWAVDGSTIVFVRGNHIRSVNADGTGGRRLVRNAGMPACSPIEPAIAFVVKANDAWAAGEDIGVLDLRSGNRRVLPGPTGATGYASPSWSPDGSRIVFEAERDRTPSDPVIEEEPAWAAVPWYFTELFVVSTTGTSLTRLTENWVGDRWPDWLPDGRIFFLSNRAGPADPANGEASQGYVMNSDGAAVELFNWDPTYS